MARRKRCSDAGYVYHVLNRAVGRATIFDKPADYAAFEKVLRQAWERLGTRLLAYLLMPNHWHLVVWPEHDGELRALPGSRNRFHRQERCLALRATMNPAGSYHWRCLEGCALADARQPFPLCSFSPGRRDGV